MRLSSVGYNIKQGFKNIGRNKMFSIASIATMTACIFLFGVFASILMNVNSVRKDLEERVGITVFFKDGTSDDEMKQIGEDIKKMNHVTKVTFTSAEKAWKDYQKKVFKDNPELAEGFKDNPLANSASYTVLVDRIENQNAVVSQIKQLDNVRQVNQSSGAATTLKTFNRVFTYVSVGIIVILLIVATILISNTISVGISVRKNEIAIMKLIGATDAFVRMPFVVEGLVLGLIGSILPLVILYFTYDGIMSHLISRFSMLKDLQGVLLGVNSIFAYLVPVSIILGVGIGLIGALITVRKHLEV